MLAICIHVLRDLDYASSIWNLGFHQLSVYSTIYAGNEELSVTQGDNPFRFVLLVNTPQLVLSTVYLLINNLLTDMLGAWEWSKLGKVKTRLRTTVPRGQQRSTYFLQLPYKYAVPLISIMSVMHFLVSSSLYVVDIIVYSFNTASYDTVGGWVLDFFPACYYLCAFGKCLTHWASNYSRLSKTLSWDPHIWIFQRAYQRCLPSATRRRQCRVATGAMGCGR